MGSGDDQRRVYGHGALFERNGGWYGQWRVNGKLRKRRIGDIRGSGGPEGLTRRQADAVLQELMVRSRAEAAPPKLEELTVEELMRRYAADRGRALKETTLEDYWSCVRVQLAPQFRTRPVADLKSADVEDLITRLTAACRAPKTVRNYVTILSTLLNYAVRREWLTRNVAAGVALPRLERKGLDVLSRQEVRALIDAAPTGLLRQHDRALYAVAAMAGLRYGECIALRWRAVDFDRQRLRVERGITRGRESDPKSHEVRSVPMAPLVAHELVALRETPDQPMRPSDFVFASPVTRRPPSRSGVIERYQKALATAGIRDGFRFHDLRHTFGTTMAAAGEPVTTIQAWMGHSDLKTTQRYLHYAPAADEAARVAAAFGE